MLLELKQLSKNYGSKKILKKISTQFTPGLYGLLGANGTGKTTLLNIMSTVAPLSSGRINYNGMMLDTLTQSESADLRLHKFGFVFQKYYLLPTLNIYDNICLPLILADKSPKPDYINELCEVLELTD